MYVCMYVWTDSRPLQAGNNSPSRVRVRAGQLATGLQIRIHIREPTIVLGALVLIHTLLVPAHTLAQVTRAGLIVVRD
jgi:hypothetical protein